MKIAMSRLNRARVSWKHAGIPAPKSEIEGFRDNVGNFFVDNTPKIFEGKHFDEISMVDLVQFERTKSSLKEAENLIREGRLKDALTKTAIAFAELVDDYEEKRKGQYGRSPFFFGAPFAFQRAERFGSLAPNLDRFLENVGEALTEIQEAMKIVSLGLDYRQYSRFRLYTPIILRLLGGSYEPQWWLEGPEGQLVTEAWDKTPEEACRFCFDFVIESSMRLQAVP